MHIHFRYSVLRLPEKVFHLDYQKPQDLNSDSPHICNIYNQTQEKQIGQNKLSPIHDVSVIQQLT